MTDQNKAAAPAPATARGGDALRIAVEALDALSKWQEFNAYRKDDPLALRFEFETEEERLTAANALDEAFAAVDGGKLSAALASQPQATGGAVEREAIALAEYVCGLLPSLAGAADQPDNKVYAAYANKGEIMGARDRLAALKNDRRAIDPEGR